MNVFVQTLNNLPKHDVAFNIVKYFMMFFLFTKTYQFSQFIHTYTHTGLFMRAKELAVTETMTMEKKQKE